MPSEDMSRVYALPVEVFAPPALQSASTSHGPTKQNTPCVAAKWFNGDGADDAAAAPVSPRASPLPPRGRAPPRPSSADMIFECDGGGDDGMERSARHKYRSAPC